MTALVVKGTNGEGSTDQGQDAAAAAAAEDAQTQTRTRTHAQPCNAPAQKQKKATPMWWFICLSPLSPFAQNLDTVSNTSRRLSLFSLSPKLAGTGKAAGTLYGIF